MSVTTSGNGVKYHISRIAVGYSGTVSRRTEDTTKLYDEDVEICRDSKWTNTTKTNQIGLANLLRSTIK